MTAIFKREVKSYFHSMIGYIFIAFLLAVTGIYFMVYNLNYGYPYFSFSLYGIMFVFLIAVPVLTMKCFAEEQKNKTDQLLLTAPVSVTGVVLGKYFAMLTVFLIPNIIYCVYPLIIKSLGTAHLRMDYIGIFTFFVLGAVYISIGMFISALTESQIIAAIGTFGVLLFCYLMNGMTQFLPTSAAGNVLGLAMIFSVIVFFVYHMTSNWLLAVILEVISVAGCGIAFAAKSSLFESLLPNIMGKFVLTNVFSNAVFDHILDVNGLIMQLSLIFIFIFLTIQVIWKRRWS